MNKQVVYVSVLINIIIVSFITGYLINSKNNESSEIIETKLTETTTNSESNLAETTNLESNLNDSTEIKEKEKTVIKRVVPKPKFAGTKYETEKLGISFFYTPKFTEPVSKIYNTPGQSNPDFIGDIKIGFKESVDYWEELAKTREVNEGGPDYITIEVYKNSQKLEPTDWIIANENSLGIYTNYNPKFSSNTLTKIKIDGFEAVKYTWSGLGSADVVVVYNSKTNIMYKMNVGYFNEESEIRTLFKELLTTISFV